MKYSKVFNSCGLVINIATLVLSVFGVIFIYFDLGMASLTYFTFYAGLIAIVYSIVSIVYNGLKFRYPRYKIPPEYASFKLMCVTTLMVSFFVPLAFAKLIDSYFYIIRVVVAPLMLFNFIFFDFDQKLSFKQMFYALIPVVTYGFIISLLIIFNVVQPPYTFLNVVANSWYINLIYGLIIILGTILLGYLINLLNHCFRRLFIGEEYVETGYTTIINKIALEAEEDAKKEVNDNENNNEENQNVDDLKSENSDENNDSVENKKPISSYQKKYSARVYHISRQKIVGKWQVKLANSKKAIKYFDTQLEAINYAKGLVKTQGGSIRVHSLTGQMRKS